MLEFAYPRYASTAEGGPPTSAAKDRAYSKSAPTYRTVIIEDELLVAWGVEEVLESLGHEVLNIYSNGEAALAAGIGDASLVIVDINLGTGLDGIATAAKLRQITNVPVVFCSAYSDNDTRQRAMAAVPNAAFVVKPFVERDLLRAIEAATRTQH